jgi:hypothetical protein
MRARQRARHVAAIVVTQPDVEQDGIGRESLDGPHGPGGAIRFADDAVAARVEQLGRGLPKGRLIVDDHYAHHADGGLRPWPCRSLNWSILGRPVAAAWGSYASAVTVRIMASLDAWQRGHAVAAVPVAVIKKFLDDRASSLAALMAYYAFFSLFPLMLVFVSVLGFVLEDDPSLQADIVDSTLARIPVIGAQLDDEVAPLTGSALGLAVGLAGALWAGLGVTLALGRAFQEIWDVPRLEQRGPVRARVYGVAVLVVLGALLIGSTLLGGLAIGGGIGPVAQRLGALLLSLTVNAAAFLAVFGLLTQGPLRRSFATPRGRRARGRP